MGIYESKYPGLEAKAVIVVMYDISFSFPIFSPSSNILVYSRSPDLWLTYLLLKWYYVVIKSQGFLPGIVIGKGFADFFCFYPKLETLNPDSMELFGILSGLINKEQEKREFISWRKIVVRKFEV